MRAFAFPPATGQTLMRDPEIRGALARELRRQRKLRGHAIAVQELGLCRSDALVDVAVVGRWFHGFEIKSDYDTLRRLAGQVHTYGLVLDLATLVVGRAHVKEARAAIPSWWGLMVVECDDGEVVLREARTAKENPCRNARALAELIWLPEAQELLAQRGALRGFRDKPRHAVWDRLCEVYTLDEIASNVRSRLKARAAAGLLRPLS